MLWSHLLVACFNKPVLLTHRRSSGITATSPMVKPMFTIPQCWIKWLQKLRGVLIRDLIKLQHKVNVTCLKDLKKFYSKAIKCRHLLCVDFDFIGFIQ